MENIVVLGDSITWHPIVGGLWCAERGMAASDVALDWFNLIEAAHPEYTWYCPTRDQASFDFVQIAAQLPTLYAAVDVRCVIVQAGEHGLAATTGLRNDAEIASWLEVVGNFCRAKGAHLAVLSRLIAPAPPYDPDTGVGLIDRLFREATAYQRGSWIDLSYTVNIDAGNKGDDPCNDPELGAVQGHPNDAGHQAVADTVSAWVSAVL
ncbi:MAG: SGNH/GDSL hydrolase family protein [Myxococcales bacterium]|nr:SGNH/GDSL hydrolase family protein [Myxococcales bacterium]